MFEAKKTVQRRLNPRVVIMPTLSSLAAQVPPVTTKLASWQLPVLSDLEQYGSEELDEFTCNVW